MIDWIDEFIERFSKYKEVQNLMADKFHGSIKINFCDGNPKNYDLCFHRKAIEEEEN